MSALRPEAPPAAATVCLDPGHGGRDPGARADHLVEAEVTLDLARRAAALLRERHRVVLTRGGDRTVALRDRVAAAEAARADLFLSIHVNAAPTPRAAGYEVYVRPQAPAGAHVLAAALLLQFERRWPGRPNRGVRTARFAVLRQARPACLVECFFLTNPEDRRLLADPAARAQLGEALAWGCGNALRQLLPAPPAAAPLSPASPQAGPPARRGTPATPRSGPVLRRRQG